MKGHNGAQRSSKKKTTDSGFFLDSSLQRTAKGEPANNPLTNVTQIGK